MALLDWLHWTAVGFNDVVIKSFLSTLDTPKKKNAFKSFKSILAVYVFYFFLEMHAPNQALPRCAVDHGVPVCQKCSSYALVCGHLAQQKFDRTLVSFPKRCSQLRNEAVNRCRCAPRRNGVRCLCICVHPRGHESAGRRDAPRQVPSIRGACPTVLGAARCPGPRVRP